MIGKDDALHFKRTLIEETDKDSDHCLYVRFQQQYFARSDEKDVHSKKWETLGHVTQKRSHNRSYFDHAAKTSPLNTGQTTKAGRQHTSSGQKFQEEQQHLERDCPAQENIGVLMTIGKMR